jgi:hypothetical protein
LSGSVGVEMIMKTGVIEVGEIEGEWGVYVENG